jgi:hypothetical protein
MNGNRSSFLVTIRPTIAALTVVLAACGTGPTPDLAGTWSLTTSYGGGGFACTIQATLTLDGSGASVPGNLAQELVDCTDNGSPVAFALDTSSFTAAIGGRRISFTPQPEEAESPCALLGFQGTVSGDRMSGTVRTTPVFCQGIYVEMNGTWQAQR